MTGEGSAMLGGTKRVRAAIGAAAAVGAAAVGLGACGGPQTLDDISDPLAAVRTADHRPQGPAVRNLPYDCGLSRATLDKLVGSRDKQEQQDVGSDRCSWDGNGSVGGFLDGGSGSGLEIDLRLGGAEDNAPQSGADDYARMIESATDHSNGKTGPVADLSGLGSAAVAWTEVHDANGVRLKDPHKPGVWHGTAGTSVVFASGNVAAHVTYGGSDRAKDGLNLSGDPLPDRGTRDTALAVAAEVARALRVPVQGTPRVTASPAGKPAAAPPAACALTSKSAIHDALGQGARPKRESTYLFGDSEPDKTPGVTGDACEWSSLSEGPNVNVEWARVSGGVDGVAPVASAARDYVRHYLEARGVPGAQRRASLFTPVKGLGDEAFAAYEREIHTGDDDRGGEGYVIVRVASTLVKARCWDIDDYSADDAMNCAYKSARAAAQRVGA